MIYSKENALRILNNTIGTADKVTEYPYGEQVTYKWVLTMDQIRILLSTAFEEGLHHNE